ncbi:11615_t:CDS:2, partial [Racocetra persica]
EMKRQELLKAGKFIAKYKHPHSKTHSKLLNSDLFQDSESFTLCPIISFQNINNDSFNIISPNHFKNANGLNSTINLSTSKKRTTELLPNKNDY